MLEFFSWETDVRVLLLGYCFELPRTRPCGCRERARRLETMGWDLSVVSFVHFFVDGRCEAHMFIFFLNKEGSS